MEGLASLRWPGALMVLFAVACGSQSQRPGATPPVDAGADPFVIEAMLASDVLATAPTTVGIVTWSVAAPGIVEAHIDFGLDTTYGMTAPVDLGVPDYRTLLLGMKPARTYHFRVVATDGSRTYTSSDRTITTGAPTTLIPPGTVSMASPGQMDRGFITTSFWTGEFGYNGATVFIIDTDGEVVWWYTDPGIVGSLDGVGRARLSANGHDVWIADAQTLEAPLRRVSLDTLDAQDYPNTGGTHDIAAVSGDTMAYLDTKTTNCARITEVDKSGATRMIFDSATVLGTRCHGNAIRYSQKPDVYVFSDRNNDVFVMDRAGNLQWKLSDKVSGGHAAWGGVQHGVQLLESSILIFANDPAGDGTYKDSGAIEYGLDGSVVKKFTSDQSTQVMGDVQRLPSGNTLINYSVGLLQEVDPDGNVVLQIDLGGPVGYTEFRKSLYGPPLDIQQ